jgi:hypothetical protein
MTKARTAGIRRLNILLKLPGVNVFPLNEREWNALLDDLYFAVYGRTGREFKQDTFHFAMTKQGIDRAQSVLRDRLPLLMRKMEGTDSAIQLELEKQWVLIATGPNGKYHRAYASADGPTLIYSTLTNCLIDLQLTCRNLLTCANPACQAVFVPLRKPHAGKPSYCGTRCAQLIAQQNYRKRNTTKLRSSERKRNTKRYVDKMHRQHGKKVKIQERRRSR